jgi:hypothetical protein
MRNTHIALAILALLFTSPVASRAGVIHDESLLGDLSDDGASPTLLAVSLGVNQVIGSTGLVDGARDLDLFRIVIPEDAVLSSLRFSRYDETPTRSGGSFLAIAAGGEVDTGLGSVHLSNVLVNGTGEWLDDLAAGSRFGPPHAMVTGLVAPLAAGEYTVWFEEISTTIDYSMELEITPVPEPCTGGLLLAGLFAAPYCHRLAQRVARVRQAARAISNQTENS